MREQLHPYVSKWSKNVGRLGWECYDNEALWGGLFCPRAIFSFALDKLRAVRGTTHRSILWQTTRVIRGRVSLALLPECFVFIFSNSCWSYFPCLRLILFLCLHLMQSWRGGWYIRGLLGLSGWTTGSKESHWVQPQKMKSCFSGKALPTLCTSMDLEVTAWKEALQRRTWGFWWTRGWS